MPKRGELWLSDFDLTSPQGSHRTRPVLVVSVDEFNDSGADRVIVVPLSSRDPQTPFSVAVSPPLGGLAAQSWIRCDTVLTVSTERLVRRMGVLPPQFMVQVSARLGALFGRSTEGSTGRSR